MARVALRLDNQFSDVIRQLYEEKDSVTGVSIFTTLAERLEFSYEPLLENSQGLSRCMAHGAV